jgi:hypothetical protein
MKSGHPSGPSAALLDPFDPDTCTLVESIHPAEEAAFAEFVDSSETLPGFWERCTCSAWMLRMLRRQAPYLTSSLERGLRQFALGCVEGLAGTDVPAFARIVAAVQGRLAGTSTAADLARVRAEAQAIAGPNGIHGLPRFSPHAAGALAVWHSANPDPFDAAYWTAEFRTLHDAFRIVCERAAAWKPEDRAAWRGGWREAAFARTHPDVYRQALLDTRRLLAHTLRSVVPSPFGGPIRAEAFVSEHDDGDAQALLCRACASSVTDANRVVLLDGRAYGCSSCGGPFVCRPH